MLTEVGEYVRWALGLGLEPQELVVGQVSLRALIIFLVGLTMVRLGHKRLRGKMTAFDLLITIVLGSVLSRAINGSAPLFETIAAGFVIIGIHWLFSAIAFHSHRFGALIKGSPRALIENGEIRWDAMRRSHISEQDLLEALRINARLSDPHRVQIAQLERSGDISIMPYDRQPQVIEIGVEEGVKKICIELK